MSSQTSLTDDICRTRYPILLIHGTACRDQWFFCYWGRIPKTLRRSGAEVFFGDQDAWATVEHNANLLAERICEVLDETGSEKVHLIAHSKGGLEARYLVSTLGMGDRVASVTTISTPNHGSRCMDGIYGLPKWVFRLAGFFVDGWYRLFGDEEPDFAGVCSQFTTAWAERFNLENPDIPGVFYRSYAGAMSDFRSDILFWWQNLIMGRVEGENDGLVTVASARWTGFRPVWHGAGGRGMSHMDEIDFRRCPLRRKGSVVDPVDRYVEMVAELKELGL